jgi:DUF1009 family protein
MIAIIAGTGSLPLEASAHLMRQQKNFFVVSLFPEDNLTQLQTIIGPAAEIIAEPYYRPGDILQQLKNRGTTHVLFVGKVDKSNLFKHLSFDWLAIKLMGSLVTRGDKDIMNALLAELAKHGINTLRQDEVLGGLLVPPGVLCGSLTPALEASIMLGLRTASLISHSDIGQTVVVKDAMILAVEAIEGTDACIARGLTLGKEQIVICKAAHRKQNTRYDLPTLGPRSLEQFKPGDVAAIAWLATHTFIANKEHFVAHAQELGIVLFSVGELP